MPRCPHGFEPTQVACPQCPRLTAALKPTQNRKNNVEDITGQTFAGATVLARAESNNHGSVYWHVRLPCGHIKTIAGGHLRQQHKLGGKIRCAEGCSTRVRRGES